MTARRSNLRIGTTKEREGFGVYTRNFTAVNGYFDGGREFL